MQQPYKESDEKDLLAGWVYDLVEPWKQHRDQNFKDKWSEYYRIWRGIWKQEDQSRTSERSKLISPASQQAVEATVAEMEEATFGKGIFFDLPDDTLDEDKSDALFMRGLLAEDFNLDNVPAKIAETYLNGAIYGTGIAKIVVGETTKKTMVAQYVENSLVTVPGIDKEERVSINLHPILPEKFFIEPSATSIDDAMGCGYEDIVSKHQITEKQKDGIYNKCDLGSFDDPFDAQARGEIKRTDTENQVKLTHYEGLVPKGLLDGNYTRSEDGVVNWDQTLVEAYVLIANDAKVLKAVKNPYTMEDRSFVAYQHDTVPNRFWGRGIIEKGYNPQKALDAMLRARIDGLALSTHPMMAVDATMMPRGAKFAVGPGKTVLTQGNPREALMPFNFGNINPLDYKESGDQERMIQMATGAMDSATPTSMNARNSTASGMSMMLSGAIKRAKRTMQNIDRYFLVPLINKCVWRRVQFDDRYPQKDYKFMPVATMGIMAREYEQTQLTNMLSTIPPGSPAYWQTLKSIYNNSSLDNKPEMLQIADQMLQQAMQPPEPPPDPQLLRVQIEAERLRMDMEDRTRKGQIEAEKLLLKEREVELLEFENKIEAQKEQSDIELKQAKIASDEAIQDSKNMLEQYKAELASSTQIALKEAESRVIEAKEMTASVKEALSQMNKPKRIITDKNGRPTGIEVVD